MTLKSLGPYEILEPLGKGGMGEVYRAHDPNLKRDVAIKVLPAKLAADPDRLARLEREAHLLAALNHPNVATIHGLEEAQAEDGTPSRFLVLELVEGDTLEERLRSGPLEVEKALELAAQIARGLEAAHDKGIIHRDLKPGNIKITPNGLVKVLDFGLAKPSDAVEADAADEEGLTRSPTVTVAGTEAGVILGTAAYMSPEQARGKSVDQRTDVWSFGCVLYEMLTGQRPFARDDVQESLAAVLRDDPDWDVLPAEVPERIRSLLRRCLSKDPDRRLHHIVDARIELEEERRRVIVSGEAGEGGVTEASRPLERLRTRWVAIAVVAVTVAVVAGLAGWAHLASMDFQEGADTERSGVGEARSMVPLTSSPGLEWDPALSPDGRTLAFTRADEDDGPRHLYVKTVDGGEPVLVSSGVYGAYSPAWSPDGSRIAFMRHVDDEGGMHAVKVVSAIGGGERELGRFLSAHGLSWSPTGESLALPLRETPDSPYSIHLLSVETGQTTRLTDDPPPAWVGDLHPRFSPGGELLAFVRRRTTILASILLVPAAGGEPRTLTSDVSNVQGMDWTADGQSIIFSQYRPGQSSEWGLWRITVGGGDPEPLEISEGARYPTLARKANRLAYLNLDRDSDIWRVNGPAAGGHDSIGQPICSSTRLDLHPHYSPDGQKIAFTSLRSGKAEIWTCDADGSSPRQLTFMDGRGSWAPRWSPDSRELLFASNDPEGSHDVWVVSAAGGFPRRVATGPSIEAAPTWSRDGRSVYFRSDRSDHFEIYKQLIEGDEPVQVTQNGGYRGKESPDGTYFYFTKASLPPGPSGIWRIPVGGGDEQQVVSNAMGSEWAVLPQGILYMNHQAEPEPAFEFYDFATQETRLVAVPEREFYGHTGLGVSVSPDGRWILYIGVGSTTSDVMLVENFR